MWPFRRRQALQIECVTLAEVSQSETDYPVLTVGQSRLTDSFAALEFSSNSPTRFVAGIIVPIVDPSVNKIADLEIRIDDKVVGYLRPPALDVAIASLASHEARTLQIPVMLLSTPGGPEVRVHSCLSGTMTGNR
jgi:hypothetical protein